MVWVPTVKPEIGGSEATPLTSGTGGPRAPPPARNWTLPVGVPSLRGTDTTVALNVTERPKADGFSDEVTAVRVGEG
jgi:hypothetical protein